MLEGVGEDGGADAMAKGFKKLLGAVDGSGLGPAGVQIVGEISRRIRDMEDNVEESTKKARENTDNEGRLVKGVNLNCTTRPTSVTVEITHKLTREPKGWRVTSHKGNTAPHLKLLSKNARRIDFTTTASCTVEIKFW